MILLGRNLTASLLFDASLHSLHQLKRLPVDNWLMDVFSQINIELLFPASHAVTDAKFDVLAMKEAFGLIDGNEPVNYTVAGVQSVDPARI